MTNPPETGAAPGGPAPAPSPAPAPCPAPARDAVSVDEQILATWQALRANPDLDARHALQVIDRLLDQRGGTATTTPPVSARTLTPGSSTQQTVLFTVMHALFTADSGEESTQ
jgi:hypothetical protein